jgi:type IX secretion system PorP/SprF family membrane protein
MKYIYISLFIALSINTLSAQSGLKLTDYYHNPIQFNPAYVGVTDGYYIKGFYTTQWLGFDGSPQTQTLDVQRLMNNERHAVGLSLLNDNFGAVQNFNLEANYALHLNLTDDLMLALGLKAGVNMFSINYDKLDIYDQTDEVYSNGNLSEAKPIMGAGFYLYQDKWFLGLAVPNLLQHRLKDEFQRLVYNKVPHFYTTFGYNFDANNQWEIRSQLMMQVVKGAPLAFLLSSKAVYNEKLGLGINYQPNGTLGAMVSFMFDNGITISYGYDFAATQLATYSNGNHSLGMSFTLQSMASIWSERLVEDKPYIIR